MTLNEPVRLAKRVAALVPCSRREAELYIEGGWVRVDGIVVEEPQFRVGPGQRVEIDAKGFRTSRGAYVLTITSVNEIAGATPIFAGIPVIGSIEASFSTDVFQFTPNETETAIIDVTRCGFR